MHILVYFCYILAYTVCIYIFLCLELKHASSTCSHSIYILFMQTTYFLFKQKQLYILWYYTWLQGINSLYKAIVWNVLQNIWNLIFQIVNYSLFGWCCSNFACEILQSVDMLSYQKDYCMQCKCRFCKHTYCALMILHKKVGRNGKGSHKCKIYKFQQQIKGV